MGEGSGTRYSEVIEALVEWLQKPEQSDLRRAFVGWLRQVLLPRRMPEAEVPELENLQEVRTLLAERVKEWSEQWRDEGRREGRREGRQEGREEGLREGRQEGEALLLMRLLERKFGPLEPMIRQRITEADADRLLAWGEQLLTADRLEKVFR